MKLSKNQNNRKRCVKLTTPIFVQESSCVVGPKEGTSYYREGFDTIFEDPFLGKKSWEEAESTLQRDAVSLLLQKSEIRSENIRYLFGGDLLGQSIASCFGLKQFERYPDMLKRRKEERENDSRKI